MRAPNASNDQPWTFTAVREQALLDRISRGAKSHILGTMPAEPKYDHYGAVLSDPNFQIFYRAPVMIVISGIAQVPFKVEDCALAAENLMLAAHAVGLGTGWIGFSQTFFNTPDGKSALGIPATWAPFAPIIVGHPQAVREPALPGVPTGRKELEIRWLG